MERAVAWKPGVASEKPGWVVGKLDWDWKNSIGCSRKQSCAPEKLDWVVIKAGGRPQKTQLGLPKLDWVVRKIESHAQQARLGRQEKFLARAERAVRLCANKVFGRRCSQSGPK